MKQVHSIFMVSHAIVYTKKETIEKKKKKRRTDRIGAETLKCLHSELSIEGSSPGSATGTTFHLDQRTGCSRLELF